MKKYLPALALLFPMAVIAADAPPAFNDTRPQRYEFSARGRWGDEAAL